MAAVERLGQPGWCRNLVGAAGMGPGDGVLIVVDEPLVEEGSQLLAAVKDAGAEPRLELWAGKHPLARAPVPVREGVRESSACIFLAQRPRGDEARARFDVQEGLLEHGGRGLFLGFIDPPLLQGELSEPAVDLEVPARRLLDELDRSSTIRIRGEAGTDLTLDGTRRRGVADLLPLESGGFVNYPNGEVYIAPLRHGADGVLVADLTISYTSDGLVDAPVTLRFERGIGFNPTVKPRGHIMLDEKAAGTAHVAIGRNTGSYGGDNEAGIHVDCVFSAPQVEADGRPIPLP